MRNIIVAFVLLGSLAFANSKTSIAVADLEARGMTKDEGGIISDRLREELLNTGVFRVMERSVMDQILKEQSFQQTGVCTGSDCQVQVGRMLGVDRLVIGSVGKLGTLYTLSIRMLNVETGEIEQSFSQDHQGAIEDLVRGPIRAVAAKLAWAISSKKNPQVAPAPEASLTASTPIAPAPQSAPVIEPVVATTAPAVAPAPQPQPAPTVQPLEVGLRLHFGATTLSGSKAMVKYFGENEAYWQMGGEIRINLNSLSLMAEMLYTQRLLVAELEGSEWGLAFDESFKTETKLAYLSVPLLIGLNLTPRVQIFAGPALDFQLSNEIKTTLTIQDESVDTTYKDIDGFETFYPSLIAGAAMRFGGFLIDFRYQMALADAYKETVFDSIKAEDKDVAVQFSNWALSFGYLF